MTWDPSQYLRYDIERSQPARDLIAALGDVDPTEIVDLGCGTGNSTALLEQRWPDASLTGVDGSTEMLNQASQSGYARLACSRHCDVATRHTSRSHLLERRPPLARQPHHSVSTTGRHSRRTRCSCGSDAIQLLSAKSHTHQRHRKRTTVDRSLASCCAPVTGSGTRQLPADTRATCFQPSRMDNYISSCVAWRSPRCGMD